MLVFGQVEKAYPSEDSFLDTLFEVRFGDLP